MKFSLDSIGNCQRPVFSLGVSQHMHKISKPVKILAQLAAKLRDNIERKKNLVTQSCVLLDA